MAFAEEQIGPYTQEAGTSGKTTTFTGSSMSLSGSTVTIVLGTDSAGNAVRESSKNAPEWTPSASLIPSAVCSPSDP